MSIKDFKKFILPMMACPIIPSIAYCRTNQERYGAAPIKAFSGSVPQQEKLMLLKNGMDCRVMNLTERKNFYFLTVVWHLVDWMGIPFLTPLILISPE